MRQMLIRDVAPNFRVSVGSVEIPAYWRSLCRYDDPEVYSFMVASIAHLIAEHGKKRQIYNEYGHHYKSKTQGIVIPIDQWDKMARTPVPGWGWTGCRKYNAACDK